MRLGLALGVALVVLTTGCGAAAPLLTVDKLLAQCNRFKGKPVQLAGYLGECAGYECHLYPNKATLSADVEAWQAEKLAQHEANLAERDGLKPDRAKLVAAWDRINAIQSVGVGGDRAFDRKAASFQNSYVVITGTIAKDTCTGAGGTDRSAGIEPTDIRAWTPSEGAPANTPTNTH